MREITAEELAGRLAAGEALEIVDIREAEAHAAWRIPGASSLPVIGSVRAGDPGPLEAAAAGLPADRPIVMVCNAGVASLRAAKMLERSGLDVASLAGGMRGWSLASSEARLEPTAAGTTIIQVRRNGKGCLSYLVGSAGSAVVVDPSVEPEVYLRIAARERLAIEGVVETHVHADHVSRARDLCEATRAMLILPETDRVTFPYQHLGDGDDVQVGGATIEALHTPGHTTESTCYLVDGAVLLSGDTLFVDSVGRPDLEKGDAGAEAGARMLHASLSRLGSLDGSVLVCPAHTSGDVGFDGVPIAATLGEIRSRVALLGLDEEEFVDRTLAGLGSKPPCYEPIIQVNEGRAVLGSTHPLDLEAGPNRCAVGSPAERP